MRIALPYLVLVLLVGCGVKPTPSGPDLNALELKRLHDEGAALKTELMNARAENGKLRAVNRELQNELAMARAKTPELPVVRPLIADLEILSPVEGRPTDDKIRDFRKTMLVVGKFGRLDGLPLGLEVKQIIDTAYVEVRFRESNQVPFVLYHPTSGLSTEKSVEISGVWKIVGTCTNKGATRHVLHFVSAK